MTKKALIVYWSQTGYTAKVASAIRERLEASGAEVNMKKTDEAADVNYFDYDLVCIGSPSLQWRPAKPIDDFLRSKLAGHRKDGKVKPTAPKGAGKTR